MRVCQRSKRQAAGRSVGRLVVAYRGECTKLSGRHKAEAAKAVAVKGARHQGWQVPKGLILSLKHSHLATLQGTSILLECVALHLTASEKERRYWNISRRNFVVKNIGQLFLSPFGNYH